MPYNPVTLCRDLRMPSQSTSGCPNSLRTDQNHQKREIAILPQNNTHSQHAIMALTTRRNLRITPPPSPFKGREADIVKKTRFYDA
jgi:hypothetical protein